MSAWIVSKHHIDYLVSAMHHYGVLDGDAHHVGQKLWSENVRSVAFLYPGSTRAELPGPLLAGGVHPSEYVHEPYKGSLTACKTLAALTCFDYQSCEHPQWESSWAYRASQDLRAAVLSTLTPRMQALIPCEFYPQELEPRIYQTAQYKKAPWRIH